jgi:erythromycin esterase-like protein
MDPTSVLVGYPNLTAMRPEAWRHYSGSFNFCARARDGRDNSSPVNPPDAASDLTRYDHVETKCAKMVERNPVVVVRAARDRRKQREGTGWRGLIDQRALCDEKVARGEPGRRGLRWSHSHVLFAAGTKPRDGQEQRDIALAIDRIDVIIAVFAHEQKIRRSGHARGKRDRDKGNWMGGVKNSCER